jgi:RimJ/RimL family protein N-acetyltransferase
MIEGRNVHLRTVKEADLPELYGYLDSVRLKGEYLPGGLLSEQRFRTQFYETGFWEEERGTLLIEGKEQRLLGAVWFEPAGAIEGCELRFLIFQVKERGKGLMSEALSLLCPYLFAMKRIERLQIAIPDYSKAALRVSQKCGFQFEGIARSAIFHRGKYQDLCIYSLLRSECTKGIEKIYRGN